MQTILVIEDDAHIMLGLRNNLRYEGYEVLTAPDGERGVELAMRKKPDLIVLDVMLPKMSGFEVCKALRVRQIEMPIIMLTARDQEIDKIMGLDMGADDYVTKPFSIRELLARVKAALRRQRKQEEGTGPLCFDDVVIDAEARQVTKSGEQVSLTAREFDLLKLFVTSPNRVLSRELILNRVWGYDYFGTTRTVDNFITRLRQKLEDDPNHPQRIVTLRGVGYKFVHE